ncbi:MULTISPECIES: putative selenate ABC transporter substrate-binding protein [unclassified Prochlorococcus]|uniref:putative selenate ABC transporter substrate-binding protein n=1 Tax=unclassified Prochlorococcus TaxID=2627481 RepID=UPI0006920372|nr:MULTISPECIES: putative selenate ABC transporter substrate-binding protein [unclassified Prochlorococcus]
MLHIQKKIKSTTIILIVLVQLLLSGNAFAKERLVISAIPDQNPEKLNRLYSLLAQELSESLGIKVIYKPVVNYQAAVSAFRTGDLDLVWFGGLTGVQARLQKPGSKVIAQRDIDANFRSVFIANTKSKIKSIKDIYQLKALGGRRFTFGSESSTSGRLMPQYFLNKANVTIADFKGGKAGFSGSHDATIALVKSGSYEAGALNEEVWKDNLRSGRVSENKVIVIWRTPPYADYHWLALPNLDKRFGRGFTKKLRTNILGFNLKNPRQAKILTLFNAKKFIEANEHQYKNIESIGRELGKIR